MKNIDELYWAKNAHLGSGIAQGHFDMSHQASVSECDDDPLETEEWLEALEGVVRTQGTGRGHYLIQRLLSAAGRLGIRCEPLSAASYLNTISVEEQPGYPGDLAMEERIHNLICWNAMVMVARANGDTSGLGGHIASYASAATLYEVGFQHFFRGSADSGPGDLVFFQAHSAPGIYARAFVEQRLSAQQLQYYRRELEGGGLPAYPHPRLMPEFWQFPTASMGLGPLLAIHQARSMKYLQNRNLSSRAGRKVWAFVGDGEMDEPEATAGLRLAGQEGLDNLIFVVNCNLQSLDGPVRGNGKIILELERTFQAAGWNVIKLIWGGEWDELLARDSTGLLVKRMAETPDGDYQTFKARGGAYTRRQFFGKYPELLALVADFSDTDIEALRFGGHDPLKVYAAYAKAVKHTGQPTVILAKTVKGYGLGHSVEARIDAHQRKLLDDESLLALRDRLNLPLTDQQALNLSFCPLHQDTRDGAYLHARRQRLGGYLPVGRSMAGDTSLPDFKGFEYRHNSGDRRFSTTKALVDLCCTLLKDEAYGKYIVPIVADEARTFGMEGLFRRFGVYSPHGQCFTAEDSQSLTAYREASDGQILQLGICEAGAMSAWIAAGTAYRHHGITMLPIYLFYAMFGYQRIGDLIWAAADSLARGFLIGAIAGRTSLAGEGLQHQDGHSHLAMACIPSCVAYDPAFDYELAVIVEDGIARMYRNHENVFYYLTVSNEAYNHPEMSPDSRAGILKGMYRLPGQDGGQVQLLGSGPLLREVIAAAELLFADFGIRADVWSVTSYSELRRDGLVQERWNRFHPDQPSRISYVEQCLVETTGPVIAVSDYVKAVADQIRSFVPKPYTVLGTDGYGRSDSREALRRHFEVDRHHIVVAALQALVEARDVAKDSVIDAINRYDIAVDAPAPDAI